MDRAEIRRAYKETRQPMGVYRVLNTVSRRSLVARSVNLPASLNRERAQLRLGAHRNAALQQDWNALGAEAFVFEVLDTLEFPAEQPGYDPADDLEVLETLWRDRLEANGEGGYVSRAGRRVPGALNTDK